MEKSDKLFNNLVGTFTDPIIAHAGWTNAIPDWLKERITVERLIQNIGEPKGEKPTATDAEACAYLMTASLDAPLNDDWTQIYLYVSTKVCGSRNMQIPPDIKVYKLTNYQTEKLKCLKDWIYEKRIEERKRRSRGEEERRYEEEKRCGKEMDNKVKGKQLSFFENFKKGGE